MIPAHDMVGAGSTVYPGFPIWWMAPVWLVNDSVKSNDFAGKTIIPFCTSASSDIGNSASTLQKMAGSGTWLTGHRFSESVSDVYGQINVHGGGWRRFVGLVIDSITTNHATRPSSHCRD